MPKSRSDPASIHRRIAGLVQIGLMAAKEGKTPQRVLLGCLLAKYAFERPSDQPRAAVRQSKAQRKDEDPPSILDGTWTIPAVKKVAMAG